MKKQPRKLTEKQIQSLFKKQYRTSEEDRILIDWLWEVVENKERLTDNKDK